METLKKPVLLASLTSLIFGALGGGLTSWAVLTEMPQLQIANTGNTTINYENGSYNEVVTKAAPSVVSVVAMKDISGYNQQLLFGPFGFSFPGMQNQQTPEDNTQNNSDDSEKNLSEVSSGTGFIVSADGLVVTNKHVVSDEEAEYVIFLDDGTSLDAKVLAKDTLNDIAILQISGDDDRIGSLPALTFGDSSALKIGDPVIAIGNALGEYANTTTAGIVSATDRQIMASGTGFGAESLVNLIQTDAAINPGNSGGPLLNLAGEVIGMNTAIDTTASGIGFAIPSNDVSSVVKSYQEYGKIIRPYVGVRYVPVTPILTKKLELGVDHGVYVIGDQNSGPAVLADSPAEKAGLKEGDVILSVNDTELSGNFTLQNAIAEYSVGDTVTLEVYRKGETIKLSLTLAESPEAEKTAEE
ncbi:MAG: trypsin-like peptidase domain-containing protein [Candidatus Gracilibacteria bacterium]|jgi:serine protease Do